MVDTQINFDTLKPRGIKIERDITQLRIATRGTSLALYLLLGLTCTAAILGVGAFLLNGFINDSGILFWVVSGLIVLLSGIAICASGYLFLAAIINRTVITVTPNKLTSLQKPMPVGHSQRHALSDIRAIRVSQSRYLTLYATRLTYGIQIITKQGKTHQLVIGFRRSTEPTYIVNEIKKFLSQ